MFVSRAFRLLVPLCLAAALAHSAPAATFTVTTTADSGPGSLREAIELANATPGADTIAFRLPWRPPFRIAPHSPLPELRDGVTVDGTTQPAHTKRPTILLDGSRVGASDGLVLKGSFVQVRGLAIGGFSGCGLRVGIGSYDTISGNYIGLDTTGENALPNDTGVCVSDALIGPTNLAITQNVISANYGYAIYSPGYPRDQRIQGNVVGLDADGTREMGNGSGIYLYAWRGNITVDGNVVAGNRGTGISVLTSHIVNLSVSRNLVGTTRDGLSAVPNQRGIRVDGNGWATISDNVVSGNLGDGVNAGIGVGGILRVFRNRIGTDPSGTKPLGNGGSGLVVPGASDQSFLGAADPTYANTIAFNTLAGVALTGPGNSVRPGLPIGGNSIHHNGGLAIDLQPDGAAGPTANDPGDADTGPNGLQNHPVLSSASSDGGATVVFGALTSRPVRTYRLEFFASSSPGSALSGDAELYIGYVNVTTDGAGQAVFTVSFPLDLSKELPFLTATATDVATRDTSEVSPAVAASPAGDAAQD